MKKKKKKKFRKTAILGKHLDFQAARNQGRSSMPKLKIGQHCPIMIRVKSPKFQVFLKLSTWAS